VEEKEFAEIGLAKAKIQLLRDPNKGISLQLRGTGGTSAIQISVSLDGTRMQWVPLRGVNMNPQRESPMVPIMLVSDKEQFFGRSCLACQGYFRTRNISAILQCPYCSIRADVIEFTTANQLEFLDEVRKRYVRAIEGNDVQEIDLDAIAHALPNNRPKWAYSEEMQQHRSTCEKCNNRFDILGEYGCCPACGARNSLQVLTKHLDTFQTEFESVDANSSNRQDREVEWEKMTRCISDFEAMARDVQSQLTRLPMTASRRKDVQQVSFQQLVKAAESLESFFAIDLLEGIGQADREFLNKMFNRRHILTHNGGRVDQEYLDRTSEASVRLNQRVAVRSREIARLIPLLKTAAENLFRGYESIAPQ
jgi:hypothetical protein